MNGAGWLLPSLLKATLGLSMLLVGLWFLLR